MKTKLLSTLVLIGSTAISQVAAAATNGDGTITFNGAVSAQTCTINGNGTGAKNFTVTLPTVSSSTLATSGQTAGRTSFSIALTNCTPATGNVHTYFEPGTTTDIQTGNLILDSSNTSNAAGTVPKNVATNVEISLLNSDTSPIKAGAADASQNSKPVPITGGSATLNYYAQYIATGAATAGTANSSVMYTISYQ